MNEIIHEEEKSITPKEEIAQELDLEDNLSPKINPTHIGDTLILDSQVEFANPNPISESTPKKNSPLSSQFSSATKSRKTPSSKKNSTRKQRNMNLKELTADVILNKKFYTMDSSSSDNENENNNIYSSSQQKGSTSAQKLSSINTSDYNKKLQTGLNCYKSSVKNKRKRQEKIEELQAQQYNNQNNDYSDEGEHGHTQMSIQQQVKKDQTPHPTSNGHNANVSLQVDKDCEYRGTVLQDYHAILNLTDVAYGVLGHNKFYLMQVIQTHHVRQWVVFFKWGRVGAKNPQTKHIKFYNMIDAILEFEKKFKQKTMNLWKNRFHFKHVEGKYLLIQTQNAGPAAIQRDLKDEKILRQIIQDSFRRDSQLDWRVQMLMNVIWDVDRMKRTMSELNFDSDQFPLGRLTKQQIQKGFSILSKIQKILLSGKRQI